MLAAEALFLFSFEEDVAKDVLVVPGLSLPLPLIESAVPLATEVEGRMECVVLSSE